MASPNLEVNPSGNPGNPSMGINSIGNQANGLAHMLNGGQHARRDVVNHYKLSYIWITDSTGTGAVTSAWTSNSASPDSRATSYSFRFELIQEPDEADKPTVDFVLSKSLLQVSATNLQRLENCVATVGTLCNRVVRRIGTRRKRIQVNSLVGSVQDQKRIVQISFQKLKDRVTASSTESATEAIDHSPGHTPLPLDPSANGLFEKIQSEIEGAKRELGKVESELDNCIRENERKPDKTVAYESVLTRLGRAGMHVASYQTYIDRLLAPPTSPHGAMPRDFTSLRNASLATRTFYRRLCKACPLNKSKQGHSHRVRIALLPDKEAAVDVSLAQHDAKGSAPSQMESTRTTHLVAIESALEKDSLVWFEAASTVQIPQEEDESVLEDRAEDSSNQLVRTRPQLKPRAGSNDSGYLSNGTPDLCQSVQVCIGSLGQGSDGLAMLIDDEQGGYHEVHYLPGHLRPAEEPGKPERKCQKLSEIFDYGNERNSNHASFEVSKRLASARLIVAACIAVAALRYSWQEWLGGAWSSDDILFHCVNNTFEPFLRIEMFDRETSSGYGKEFMFRLGIVLMEVGLWRRVSVRSLVKGALQELEALQKKTNREYREVVGYCIAFANDESWSSDMDQEVFQKTFYDEVVSPLKTVANRFMERQREDAPEPGQDDSGFVIVQETK